MAFDVLIPSECVRSVLDIDLDRLRSAGRRLILSDLDNTLAPWRHDGVPMELVAWYQAAVALGFDLCIVSNGAPNRVQAFARQLGIQAIGGAGKPSPRAFVEAMEQYGASPAETIMVGDQLLTDVRGGNRCGLHTILVLPIDPKEWWGTRINRLIEWFLIRTVLKTKFREVKWSDE